MPSFPAACGFISTQLHHIAVVSGSGSSCSHGRCASDPSSNACDGYGAKWNGYACASPSNSGRAPCRRRRCRGARRRGRGRPSRSCDGRLGLRLSPAPSPRRSATAAAGQRLLQPPSYLEQHVGRRARVVERLHRRSGHGRDGARGAGLGHRLHPRLEERVVRQDQIRVRAGVVDERPEARDERHLPQPVGRLPRGRRTEQRHSPRRAAAPAARRNPVHLASVRGRRRWRAGLRHERHAAGRVRRCRRSAFSALTASACTRPLVCASAAPPMTATAGPVRRELARQPLDARGLHAGLALHRLRREGFEPAGPAVDERPGASSRTGRTQPALDDDVGQAEREKAFSAGTDRPPTRRRSRQSATRAAPPARTWGAHRPALPHPAVGHAVRERRVPRAEEVRAKARSGSASARGRTSAADAARSSSRSRGAAPHRRRPRTRPGRRADPPQELGDQLLALAAPRARDERDL